jgi:hypothetical protein
MRIVGTGLRLEIRARPKILLWALLLGLCSFTTSALAQAWDLARFEQMMRAAAQARERGNREEAERQCVDAFRYVDASVIKALFDYAALLKTLGRPEADAAQARAERYREIKTRPQPSSVYLGWSPSDELKAFVDLLGEIGRAAEAKAIVALAAAHDRVNKAHFARLMEQQQGRDPRGNC